MLQIEIGQKIGRLTVLSEGKRKILPSGLKPRTVDCICECGNRKTILLLHFLRGRTLSCGCIRKTQNCQSGKKLYKVLRGMIERCDVNTKSEKTKKNYFYKGIVVCDEWKNDTTAFITWAESNGYQEGLQIDRRDNSKGYSPENCRWVTPKVNCNNKSITLFIEYHGERISLKILLEKLNRDNDYYTIRRRLKRNWSPDLAIDTPIKIGNYGNKPK